ncbi:MAG: ABC transporter substrate-binding protein [Actinomycetota bacterium]|nr:ABC transporter substrate-binding protein [Actinomycetota bacterium]
MNRRRGLLAVASAGVLAVTLAACGGDTSEGTGSDGSSGGGGASGDPWILGTTETVTAMDPAGSYDFGSWNMQYNIFEQLLSIPAGGSDPEGDAAESCEYDDPQTVSCALKDGLKFSNGHDLTSSDVKFSLERNINIADPNGSSVLLGSIIEPDSDPQAVAKGAIETPDEKTVVFHLNQADTTFVKVLSTATASIVDEEAFPADKLIDDNSVVGSGPYKLSQYKAGDQAVLAANETYTGERAPQSEQIFVQYFSATAPLKQAVEGGDVDIAWRTLSPTDLNDLEGSDSVEVIKGEGSEFRYWVWQFNNDVAKDQATRQAVAQVIDREAIAQDSYDGTVEPAYSIVPPGFGGQKDSFKEAYGEPDVDAAKKLLDDAGIETPVELTLGYTPTHYGPNAVDEATQLAAQLNDSKLFDVTTEDAEWEEYQTLYKEGAYDLFILGWYPDFLDADNYLSPFIRDGGFYENGYSNDEVNKLLDEELGATDDAAREEIFGQLQDIVAEDVPLMPSWNGQNVAVAGEGMEGVEDTLDATYIFRFWQISKSG